jgi:hypothetical protein
MTRTLPRAPHDDITYLTALARVLGEDSCAVMSLVENQYRCSAYAQPEWFEAERVDKAALLRTELATTIAAAASGPVVVAGIDPATLRVSPPEPLVQVLETIDEAFAALLVQYEHGQRPLSAAKALIAALGRCVVACRLVEPKGARYAHQALLEPRPLSLPLTQVQVHLMLLVGQYELAVTTA